MRGFRKWGGNEDKDLRQFEAEKKISSIQAAVGIKG